MIRNICFTNCSIQELIQYESHASNTVNNLLITEVNIQKSKLNQNEEIKRQFINDSLEVLLTNLDNMLTKIHADLGIETTIEMFISNINLIKQQIKFSKIENFEEIYQNIKSISQQTETDLIEQKLINQQQLNQMKATDNQIINKIKEFSNQFTINQKNIEQCQSLINNENLSDLFKDILMLKLNSEVLNNITIKFKSIFLLKSQLDIDNFLQSIIDEYIKISIIFINNCDQMIEQTEKITDPNLKIFFYSIFTDLKQNFEISSELVNFVNSFMNEMSNKLLDLNEQLKFFVLENASLNEKLLKNQLSNKKSNHYEEFQDTLEQNNIELEDKVQQQKIEIYSHKEEIQNLQDQIIILNKQKEELTINYQKYLIEKQKKNQILFDNLLKIANLFNIKIGNIDNCQPEELLTFLTIINNSLKGLFISNNIENNIENISLLFEKIENFNNEMQSEQLKNDETIKKLKSQHEQILFKNKNELLSIQDQDEQRINFLEKQLEIKNQEIEEIKTQKQNEKINQKQLLNSELQFSGINSQSFANQNSNSNKLINKFEVNQNLKQELEEMNIQMSFIQRTQSSQYKQKFSQSKIYTEQFNPDSAEQELHESILIPKLPKSQIDKKNISEIVDLDAIIFSPKREEDQILKLNEQIETLKQEVKDYKLERNILFVVIILLPTFVFLSKFIFQKFSSKKLN